MVARCDKTKLWNSKEPAHLEADSSRSRDSAKLLSKAGDKSKTLEVNPVEVGGWGSEVLPDLLVPEQCLARRASDEWAPCCYCT